MADAAAIEMTSTAGADAPPPPPRQPRPNRGIVGLLGMNAIAAAVTLISVWVAYALLRWQLANLSSQLDQEIDLDLDIAIIGAGIGGTYAGWQLQNSSEYGASSIAIFEATNRVGGRFHSPVLGGGCAGAAAGTLPRGELGGMRVRTGLDLNMIGVAEQLGIELGPFLLNDDPSTPPTYDAPNNPVYVGGYRSARSAIAPLFATNSLLMSDNSLGFSGVLPFYLGNKSGAPLSAVAATGDMSASFTSTVVDHLEGDTSNLSPHARERVTSFCASCNCCHGNVPAAAAAAPVPHGCGSFCDSDCFIATQEYGINGTPLWQHSLFDSAVSDGTGPGSVYRGLIESLNGYHMPPSDANTGQAQAWGGESSPINGYVRPVLGMQEYPLALARAFEAAGGTVYMNEKLISVEYNARTTESIITLAKTVTSACTNITTELPQRRRIRVKRLILNMPKAPLSRIAFTTASLQDKIDELTNYIQGYPLTKNFITFASDWMDSAVQAATGFPFTIGRFTTSLSASQAFHWYPGTQQLTPASQCGSKTVLQVYTSAAINAYRSNSALGNASACAATTDANQCAASPCSLNAAEFVGPVSDGVTVLMWNALKAQLSTMFDTENIPDPIEYKRTAWSADDEVTGMDAIHWFRSGVRWWEKYVDFLEPMPKVHLIGEQYSIANGWGSGALETTMYMLTEKMGMPIPTFMARDGRSARENYCRMNAYYPNRKPE